MQAIEIIQIVVGVVVTVFCCGAVPWALKVTKLLARIEAQIEEHKPILEDLRDRVRKLELQQARDH